MAVRLDEPPDRALVLRKHTYWDKSLGKDFRLGLVEDVSLPFRVYVLECRTSRGALCQYVGIVHFSELRQRWERHWAGKVHYTSVYPPQRVLLLWPASTEAAEAFVYNELLRGMGANETWKLGGWTQTSSNPSPLGCLVTEQARRGMKELCFNCGQRRFEGEHKRLRKCPHALRGVQYTCPSKECRATILVTSRGHAELLPTPSPPPQQPPPRPPLPPNTATGGKRSQPPATVAQPPRKSAKVACAHGGLRVLLLGEYYTSLGWYLKSGNPSKAACAKARGLSDGAVELYGAHVRALADTAYAVRPPAKPKPLCVMPSGQERQKLGAEPVCTEVTGLKVARAEGSLTKRLSQVLFPVEVLQEAFSETAE
jgi:hypothetical protein